MSPSRRPPEDPRRLLAREQRLQPFAPGRFRWLHAYPAPYRVGMSSLGFLTLHREISGRPDWSVERVFLPAGRDAGPLRAWESGDDVRRFDAVGISIAHELEIGAVVRLLQGLGLAPLSRDRPVQDPPVILGGPLTGINPRPLAPFADLVVVGEADAAIHTLCDALERGPLEDLPDAPGLFWPGRGAGEPPAPLRLAAEHLPAWSAIWSPDAELTNMALVEVARSCKRACAFCASSRLAMGPCRTVPADAILAAIPEAAPRVGLVGTAVSDHPDLRRLLESVVARGREVGVSSIRVDRLDAELLELLQRGGLRTLTVGVDGASERLRRAVRKGVTEEHLVRAAELAQAAHLRRLKLYQLVGLPEEADADLDELVALVERLARIVPVTLTVTPFVPKPGTPLFDASPLPVKEIQRRLKRVQHRLRRVARVRPDSARWAWVEAQIARGDAATGEAVLAAERAGGRYADYRRALGA